MLAFVEGLAESLIEGVYSLLENFPKSTIQNLTMGCLK